MRATVGELRAHLDEPTYIAREPQTEGDGFGAINAARGSLEHWVRIRDGKIANYQIITPTAWNGSPRDSTGRRGHWEESFVGLEIEDLDNPVELFHVGALARRVPRLHGPRRERARRVADGSRSHDRRAGAVHVVCLGNPWHGDDGFGQHVFRRLPPARRSARRRSSCSTRGSPASTSCRCSTGAPRRSSSTRCESARPSAPSTASCRATSSRPAASSACTSWG